MERSKFKHGSLKLGVSFCLNQDLTAGLLTFERVWLIQDSGVTTLIALEDNKVEGTVATMIRQINVNSRSIRPVKVVDNPLESSGIATMSSLVDGMITIVVSCVPNLIDLTGVYSTLVNFVDQLTLLVAIAFSHNRHKSELVLLDKAFSFLAAKNHLNSK